MIIDPRRRVELPVPYRAVGEWVAPGVEDLSPQLLEAAIALSDMGGTHLPGAVLCGNLPVSARERHAAGIESIALKTGFPNGLSEQPAAGAVYMLVMLVDEMLPRELVDASQQALNRNWEQAPKRHGVRLPDPENWLSGLSSVLGMLAQPWATIPRDASTTWQIELSEMRQEPALWKAALDNEPEIVARILERAAETNRTPGESLQDLMGSRPPLPDVSSFDPRSMHALNQVFLRKAIELNALFAGELWRFRPRGPGSGIMGWWLASVALDLATLSDGESGTAPFAAIARVCLKSEDRLLREIPTSPAEVASSAERSAQGVGLGCETAFTIRELRRYAGRGDHPQLRLAALRNAYQLSVRQHGTRSLATRGLRLDLARSMIDSGAPDEAIEFLTSTYESTNLSEDDSQLSGVVAIGLLEAGRIGAAAEMNGRVELAQDVEEAILEAERSRRHFVLATITVGTFLATALGWLVATLAEALPLFGYNHVYAYVALLGVAPACVRLLRRATNFQHPLLRPFSVLAACVLGLAYALGVQLAIATALTWAVSVPLAGLALGAGLAFFLMLTSLNPRLQIIQLLIPNIDGVPDHLRSSVIEAFHSTQG